MKILVLCQLMSPLLGGVRRIERRLRQNDQLLIHVDTELAAKDLLNSRMAYVAVSRGAEDAQLYTNDRAKLPEALGHDVSHESAHTPAMKPEQVIKPLQPEIAPLIEHGLGLGHSL
jgi:hypothetical protein